MSDLDDSPDRFQGGDHLVVEALRQPMLAHMESHLAELARRARVPLSDADRRQIAEDAFGHGCADHTRYLPQYASLDVWFTKHADSFALAFAARDPSRAPLALVILFQYAATLDLDVQRRFGMIAAEDRSDIVFQGLLAAYERASSFIPHRGVLESWLRALITFHALTFLRKHHNGQIRGADAELLIAQTLAPDALGEIAAQAESAILPGLRPQIADLDPLLDRLPERTADAIRRYLRGESYEQIAQGMSITNGHARVLIHRGRSALQQQGEAIRLHLSGRSVDEIAQTLDVTPRRIRKHISLSDDALRRFKSWLSANAPLFLVMLTMIGVGVADLLQSGIAWAPDQIVSNLAHTHPVTSAASTLTVFRGIRPLPRYGAQVVQFSSGVLASAPRHCAGAPYHTLWRHGEDSGRYDCRE